MCCTVMFFHVHFVNFTSFQHPIARVGRSYELALCRYVILDASLVTEREFAGLGALNAPRRYTIAV